jgi:hypothetical protein
MRLASSGFEARAGYYNIGEADQRFSPLFLKEGEHFQPWFPIFEALFSWGQAPKPPGSASPNFWVPKDLLRSRPTLFASFSGKRRTLSTIVSHIRESLIMVSKRKLHLH